MSGHPHSGSHLDWRPPALQPGGTVLPTQPPRTQPHQAAGWSVLCLLWAPTRPGPRRDQAFLSGPLDPLHHCKVTGPFTCAHVLTLSPQGSPPLFALPVGPCSDPQAERSGLQQAFFSVIRGYLQQGVSGLLPAFPGPSLVRCKESRGIQWRAPRGIAPPPHAPTRPARYGLLCPPGDGDGSLGNTWGQEDVGWGFTGSCPWEAQLTCCSGPASSSHGGEHC